MAEADKRPTRRPTRPLVIASRGDALTPYLSAALGRRYPIAGTITPDLTPRQRYLVAAASFRPSRTRWIEAFYKSELAFALRSRNAAWQEAALAPAGLPVFQIHGLFDLPRARTVMYIDCTHHQSAEHWPAWNPLSGRALQRWYARERSAYQRAAHLFAFCEPTRTSLLRDYGVAPERVSVVGAGVNFDALPTRLTQSREPVVLFVGNDFVRKGGLVLLEAFRRVRAEVPGARLQLVGARTDIPAAPGVEVLGRIGDRAELGSLYAAAQVFCLPSLFDPFPLVLLEAMAYGLPVVSSTSCGIPEIVEDSATGSLVAPADPGALAAALVALLTDPGLAADFGLAGRARVATRFGWDQVVERMAPALDRLTTDDHQQVAAEG